MATLTVRLEDDIRDQLENFAQALGVSVSELIRTAIGNLLGQDTQWAEDQAPLSINLVQRQTLSLLHQVADRLDPERGRGDRLTHHQQQIAVLCGGYTGEYATEFYGLEPELGRSDSQLVWDILDMFCIVQASVNELPTGDLDSLGDFAKTALTFRGFDSSDSRETRLLGYTSALNSS